MEKTICSYIEKNARLQLVLVKDFKSSYFELRLNRRVLSTFDKDYPYPFEARLVFLHSVHELCVNRNIHVLSNMS